jgi:hypothetical protein
MRIYDYIQNADIASLLLAIIARINTRCFAGGTLAAKATANADLKTTTTMQVSVGGVISIIAAAGTIDLSATSAGLAATAGTGVQAAAKYAAYLVTHDGASTFQCYKGGDAATAAAAKLLLPAAPAGQCPIGMLVVTNTTNPFIVGTTNSDAAGVTFTCSDLTDAVNGLGSIYADTIQQ